MAIKIINKKFGHKGRISLAKGQILLQTLKYVPPSWPFIRSEGSLDIGKMSLCMYVCILVPKSPISTQIKQSKPK